MIAASVDGDAERFCARWKSERRLCQLAQCSARDGKRADGSDGRVDDVKVVSRGVQPCIEWPDAPRRLSGIRRPGCSSQAPISSNLEAVDPECVGIGRADLNADEIGPGRVEENVSGIGGARQIDRRAGHRKQMTAGVEPESRVIASGACRLVSFVGPVHEASLYL